MNIAEFIVLLLAKVGLVATILMLLKIIFMVSMKHIAYSNLSV